MDQMYLEREIALELAEMPDRPMHSRHEYEMTELDESRVGSSFDSEAQSGGSSDGEVESIKRVTPGDESFTSMWSVGNLALTMSYFSIGFAMAFKGPPLSIYVIEELNVGPARTNVLATLLNLPWSFKLMYGLLSDCVPLWGKRRKPYLIIGWIMYIVSNIWLACLGKPSLEAILGFSLMSVVGYMLSDVMCDALIVERSRHEPTDRKGEMQAVGYTARYLGNIVGAVGGTLLYNKKEWGWALNISQIFWLNGLFVAACVLPFLYHLSDPNAATSPRPLRDQLWDIWHMVQRRTIYLPMAAIAFYNMLQIPNAAFGNFVVIGLGFSGWMLGVRLIAATIFSYMGIVFYRMFLKEYSWRTTYISTTILVVFFSALQLLLIFRINVKWGISDLLFSLGDDSIASFVNAIQFLPAVTMYIGLCPHGAEGMSYAMLTTFSNVSGTVGANIGTLLTGVWDVSNKAIASKNWDGLWKLTVLTSALQPVGLAFVWLLPKNTQHQKAMQKCERRSVWGGAAFLLFLVVAWLWTIVETIIVMLKDTEQ